MKKNCPVCKKPHDNKKYCSRICQGKHIEEKITIEKTTWKKCPVCDKPHKNSTFCSNKCKGSAFRVVGVIIRAHTYKRCPVCEKEFRVVSKKKIHCSDYCKVRKYKFNKDYFCDVSCIKANTNKTPHTNNYLTLTPEKANMLGLIFRFGKIADFNQIKFYCENEKAIDEIKELLNSNYPTMKVTRPIVGFTTKIVDEIFLNHLIEYGFYDYHFHHFPTLKPELWGTFIKAYLKWSPTRLDNAGKNWFLVPSTKIAFQLRDVGFKIFNDGRWWVG
jgi:hypothetical protein